MRAAVQSVALGAVLDLLAGAPAPLPADHPC